MCCFLGFAEESSNSHLLTLDEAFQLAASNNLEFQSKVIDIEISEAQLKTAKVLSNPSAISDNGIAENTYRAGISYTFPLGGKRQQLKNVAKSKIEATQAEVDVAWLDFRSEIRETYSNLYYSQQRLDILEQMEANSKRLLEVAVKREEVGDIPKMSVLHAEITEINTSNEKEKAKYQYHEALHHLAYLLNQELEETIKVSSPNKLPAFPDNLGLLLIDNLIETALNNRPEMKTQKISQDINQFKLKLAKANRIPDLQLAAGADIVTGSGGKTSAFVIAQMDIPLFDRKQGAIDEAKAKQKQHLLQLEAAQNKIKLEVEHAYLAYEFHQKMLQRYESELLPKSKIVAEKSQKSFELGQSPIWIPINAQTAHMESQLNYLKVLMDYQQAIGMLERSMGTGL